MKASLVCCFCLVAFFTSAQRTFDELILTRPFASCENVSYQAQDFMDGFYQRGAMDSLEMFVDYWGTKCGFFSDLNRLQTVLEIRKGTYDPELIDNNWIEELMRYKGGVFGYYRYPYESHYVYPMREGRYDFLDEMTRKIALETETSNEDLALILNFYGQEAPTFAQIRNASNQSRLKKYYDREFNRMAWYPEFHAAFLLGSVNYTDNLSFIGRRPNVGFIVGAQQQRHTYDLVFGARIGPSQRNYSFQYGDTLITHDKWTGLYLGAEYTFDVIQTNRIDVGLSGGIGLEDFMAIDQDNDYGENGKYFHSLNKNAGLVIKLKQLDAGGYAGVHVRYNWTNFRTSQPLQLDGEYLEVRLVVGSIASYFRKERLENLN